MKFKAKFIKLTFVILSSFSLLSMEKNKAADPVETVIKKPFPSAYFNTDIRKMLCELLQGEKKGVWGAFYSFDDDTLINQWAAIHTKETERDVTFKGWLLLDESEKSANIGTLDKAGIDIKKVRQFKTNKDALMHNKFFIFEENAVHDGKPLLVLGSCNATESSFVKDYNNMIIVSDARIINLYIREFHKMHQHHQDALSLKEVPEEIALPLARFTPNICSTITTLFNTTTNPIEGAQFIFASDALAHIWSQKGGTLLIEINNYKDKNKETMRRAVNKLFEKESNVSVYYTYKGGKLLHHKFLLFNINGKDVLVTGSANLSDNSFNKCWENIYVSDNKGLTKQFRDEFKRLITKESSKLA